MKNISFTDKASQQLTKDQMSNHINDSWVEALKFNKKFVPSVVDPSTGEITSKNIQSELDEEGEIYFYAPNPLPVRVAKQTGSFYPKDSRTKEISTELMFKTEAYITDPSKVHPTFYNLYSKEQKPNGFYLAVLSMSYFQGKFDSTLRYTPVSEQQFNDAETALKASGSSAWSTDMEVEIYGHEPAGKGFNHEAYLLDPIRNEPVLMDCYNSEKLQSGIYSLSVDLERRKGKLMPLNKYHFVRAHSVPVEESELSEAVA